MSIIFTSCDLRRRLANIFNLSSRLRKLLVRNPVHANDTGKAENFHFTQITSNKIDISTLLCQKTHISSSGRCSFICLRVLAYAGPRGFLFFFLVLEQKRKSCHGGRSGERIISRSTCF